MLLGLSLAALLAGSASAVDPTFTQPPGSPIATGNGTIGVAAADLNADTKRDLAVAVQGADNVAILLGNGSGGFTSAGTPIAAGNMPVAVAVADLNADTRPDLAVPNSNEPNPTGSVSILLGNGTGGFSNAAGSPVTVGELPQQVVVANLNAGASLDLAVVNEGDGAAPGSVSVLLGNGSGGFSNAAGSPVGVGVAPKSVTVGNFNGDANMDLATANEGSNNVSILLGNGAGGFPTASTVATGGGPAAIITTDLNGNGTADLIIANAGSDNVSILLGNGSGGFSNAPGSPIGVGSSPEGLAAADFNLDGKLDLAVANAGGTTMSILVGNGAGGFTAAPAVPAGGDPTTVAAADLNGDSKADLAVANYASNDVTIQLNTTQSIPTAVTLSGFAARTTPAGVELRWRTAQETALLGFEVFRAGVKLNRALIAAQGAGAGSGAAYRLLDRSARPGTATYRLRAVRTNGSRVWIGRAVARR